MTIQLQNAGKRFNREWIFRHLDYTFAAHNKYAITGANGSGKSTLLQIIAAATTLSEGQQTIYLKKQLLPPEKLFTHVSLCAPYLELIEEMTANEFLQFHSKFKQLTESVPAVLDSVNLQQAAKKQIRNFSSGMKQRLKLAQAFFSKSEVLLLDEPTTNLDADGIAIYNTLINEHTSNRIVIVSSNVPAEYAFCSEVISMQAHK